MTSLRGEILSTIANKWFENDSIDNVTDEILKLFEQKLDEIWNNGDIDDIERMSFYKELKHELKEDR